jgi:hypothetical protein
MQGQNDKFFLNIQLHLASLFQNFFGLNQIHKGLIRPISVEILECKMIEFDDFGGELAWLT